MCNVTILQFLALILQYNMMLQYVTICHFSMYSNTVLQYVTICITIWHYNSDLQLQATILSYNLVQCMVKLYHIHLDLYGIVAQYCWTNCLILLSNCLNLYMLSSGPGGPLLARSASLLRACPRMPCCIALQHCHYSGCCNAESCF